MPGAAAADDYALATWLFLRALGLVYLVAFASFAVQARGLVGEGGILPAGRLLEQVRRSHGRRAYLALPTLCWWRSDDRFLGLLCGAGILLSLLLTAGVAQVPALVGLYVLYLSLCSASGVFLGYQWDVLLLETGFVAIFAAPLDPGLAWPADPGGGPAAHPLVRWLLYWLLFRLILSSGAVKLRTGDRAWRSLTALSYHYETQPLPHRGSWWAHQLPRPLQRAATGLALAAELALPFLILAPPPWRWTAAGGIAVLMLLIAATGNYGFFNLLT
ncbi:MAG TPA: lipase maturation factor family protein, partial [Thermoanaerobaculia bacterium]|nr:lipase maturation factor family protein [Thermoanaerobaculia bacterium]